MPCELPLRRKIYPHSPGAAIPSALAAACWLLVGAAGAGPAYQDDGDRDSLLAALGRQDRYLETVRKVEVPFGTGSIPVERLRRTSRAFASLVRDDWGTPAFAARLHAEFETVSAGPTHFTGYYLPRLAASRAPDATYRFPLYRKPPGSPLPTHAQIEDEAALAGKGLEVAWVADEFDRYILMVQGSGVLRFPDGSESPVNYDGKNNHPYVSLGKALIADGKLSTASVSIPAIRKYFREHPEEQHGYLLRNPSYVFFRLQPDGPYGVDGIQLTAARSIATDKRFWPSGGVAWVSYPKVAAWKDGIPAGWETGGRFVCDQDTGGAIRGLGRVDMFWGAGEEAAAIAGTLNATGSLTYFLVR
ncbi:MAG: MltA domain-containing protein [Candidatus Sericytochromatia bacterium]|nr:MltA domain-containing protein [Candidatus Tanganyikabacteria bacterium]